MLFTVISVNPNLTVDSFYHPAWVFHSKLQADVTLKGRHTLGPYNRFSDLFLKKIIVYMRVFYILQIYILGDFIF